MSGFASTTIRSARSLPLKSGMSTSTDVSGVRWRISAMHAANISAPPCGRSSRSTLVMTTCFSSICRTASARRAGSPVSRGVGVPCGTAQYAQFRVHTSPRIMKVAALCSQHSPTLGQCASSHTVWSASSRMRCFTARQFGPPGAGTFSQAGFRAVIWVNAVAMRLGEDSDARKGTKGQISTRWLIPRWLAVLQLTQLFLQLRGGGEQAVRDLGDLLGVLPLPLQRFDLRLLVHRDLEGEPPLRGDAAKRQLPPGHVADEALGPAGALDQPCRILGPLPATAGQRQIRQSLAQRGLRVSPDQQRALGATGGAAQDQPQTGRAVGDDAGVRHVLRAETHQAAAALADRWLD